MTTIAEIQASVCERFGLERGHMRSAWQNRGICRPRQVAMYLAQELTSKSRAQIGMQFARSSWTVLHAGRQIARLCADDPAFAATVAALSAQLVERAKRHGLGVV